jgi:hypothetical protein
MPAFHRQGDLDHYQVFPETVRFGPSALTAVFTKAIPLAKDGHRWRSRGLSDRLMSEDGQSTTEGSILIETAVGRLRLEALPGRGVTLTYYRR